MNTSHQILNVELGERGYPIHIGQNIFVNPQSWALPQADTRRAFILYDENLHEFLENSVLPALQKIHPDIACLKIPAGEASKSFSQFEFCCSWLLSQKIQRSSIIYALGGGVIGDLVGFVSSTILRGVDFVQIPTTLLAQVDSSVGGKTGINSAQGKNLIGAFYQPRSVLIDLHCLHTLPTREMRAGYAEIVKYALLGDENFFSWLELNSRKIFEKDENALMQAIHTCCAMKAAIVKNDECEKNGQRILLNLGHTFAHALEAAASYDGRLLHGEAVGIGLVLAARLSHHLGYVGTDIPQKIQRHLRALSMMTEISDIHPHLSCTPRDLINLMSQDKKSDHDGVHFILLKKIGEAQIHHLADFTRVEKILRESSHGT